MDINNVLLNDIEMYSHERMNFIVGLCEKLNLPEVFNKNLEKTVGRKTDIPYGIMAEMMLINICDNHHPLYRLNEYYEMKEINIGNKQWKTIGYLVMETECTYKDTDLKCSVCYSKNLEETKRKTIESRRRKNNRTRH